MQCVCFAWDNTPANDLSDTRPNENVVTAKVSLFAGLFVAMSVSPRTNPGNSWELVLGEKDLMYSVRSNFGQIKQERSTLTPT